MKGETNKSIQGKLEEKFQNQNHFRRRILQLEAKNILASEQIESIKKEIKRLSNKTIIKSVSNIALQKERVALEIINTQKMIIIKKKQLSRLKKTDNLQEKLATVSGLDDLINIKYFQIEALKNQVKELQASNRGIQRKISLKSKRSKSDTNIKLVKSMLSENKFLKQKISSICLRKEATKRRMKTQVDDISTVKNRLTTLPDIVKSKSKKSITDRNQIISKEVSLEKQKSIYTKWIKSHKALTNQKLQIQIVGLQNQQSRLMSKINIKTHQSQRLRQIILELKKNQSQISYHPKTTIENPQKRVICKDKITGVWSSPRSMKKDWFGKFDGLRFSDSRIIRQQCRLFEIIHNDEGYYRFGYYSVKTKEQYRPQLPFDAKNAPRGLQKCFAVVYPDYIKNISFVMDLSIARIVGIKVTSNTGIQYEFLDKIYRAQKKDQKQRFRTQSLDIGPDQLPTCMFGSYYLTEDTDGNVIDIFLQGLGADIIEEQIILK